RSGPGPRLFSHRYFLAWPSFPNHAPRSRHAGEPGAGAVYEGEEIMRRFILTGALGAGKTSILRALAADGYAVVPEAATDVVVARLALEKAEHWADPVFIDRIAALQRQRRQAPVRPALPPPLPA